MVSFLATSGDEWTNRLSMEVIPTIENLVLL